MRPGGTSGVPPPKHAPEILPEHMPDGHLSIAVFGPGRGEAIVVRLPDGRVGVVDGCREPDPKHPKGRGDPVRELLERFVGSHADPERFRLEFVGLTHAHDDHYGGVGRLLHAFHGRVDEIWEVEHGHPRFLPALQAWTKRTFGGKMPDEGAIKGLERILDSFDKSRTEGGSELKRFIAGRPLLKRSVDGHELTITACGPADADIQDATNDLLARLQDLRDRRRPSRPAPDLNLTSSALLLRWGQSAMLLAGDLLRGTGPHSGWTLAQRHIEGEVQVVNVAHHASVEAHHDELWTRTRPALAVITPFKFGRKPNPPRPEQIDALARTSVVAITSPPAWEDEDRPPRPMHPKDSPIRTFGARSTALSVTPSSREDDIRNAVAVSMDANGHIQRFVLAGAADVYLPAEDLAPRSRTA